MYCTSCGKPIADDDAFCRYCGKPAPQGDKLDKLVAAARMGSQDAFNALYEKTYKKVYITIKSMIKDESTVSDIMQDAYMKAFAHLDSFQGDTKFLPWIRKIARNTAKDWLKKKRPMLFAELRSGGDQHTPVEELFPDERSENLPDQVIDQKETKRLLREIIEELPEDQRAAIGMFYYEEMSVKEIAEAMGVSESAVKSRLMYGRNKIEKKLLELEKQGTKLYSLSPMPLLLLSHSQNTYATEVPNLIPDSLTLIEIDWHDIGDLSALDSWAASDPGETEPSEPTGSGTLPTDGDRIVLTGTVGTYDYDEIIALQGQPDPNSFDEYSMSYSRSVTYRVIVLDMPQTLRLHIDGEEDDYFSNEALMISIDYADDMEQYEGQHIIFSIDPAAAYWPSDTSLPLGQPVAEDIHILS